jgi:aminoglycoside phosphotransferase (APT) family kinase protein
MADEGKEGRDLAQRELGFAGDALGAGWEIVGPLDGGYQQGAIEVRAADGSRAVFKPAAAEDNHADLERRAGAIAAARGRGWPAAEWITWGVTAGRPWFVQRYALGRPIEDLDRAREDRILAIVECQTAVPSLPTFDWSEHAIDIAREGSYWHERSEAFGDRAAECASMLAARCRSTRLDVLPTVDLVHGDFATDNLLEHEGDITIIDTQSVGRGSRALDLARLSVHCLAWQLGERPAQRFLDAAREIAGPTAFHYAVGSALGVLVFSMDNYSGFVPTLADRLMALDDLTRG